MEKQNFSFLFFLKVVCTLWFILSSSCSFAEQPVDSTRYFYYKIVSPEATDDLTEGYRYFKKYAEEQRRNRDTVALVYALRLLAQSEYDLGQVYASEQTATEAKILVASSSAEIQFPEGTEIGINNLLGMLYRTTAQPQKAIQNYSKALAKTKSKNDSLTLLNNLANAYRDNGDYKKAITILTSVVENNQRENNLAETARALDNLGFIQTVVDDPNGLPNMLEALALRKNLEDAGPLFTSYNHLSNYYRSIGDTTMARSYAQLGKEVAKNVSVGYKKEALATYLSLSDNKDVTEFIQITDSIQHASLEQDNKFASIAYDFSKEQQRTQAALLEREKEKQQKGMFQIIGLMLLLLGIALYFVLKYRHRKEKLEEVYRTESQISKKVHDEVANDLYQIMTKIQTTPNTNESLLDDLDAVYHKTRDISKDHGLVGTEEAFGELLNDLLLKYQNDQVNVITKKLTRVDWSQLSKPKKIALYRVLQELMTNMRKHSEASLVVVSVEKLGATYAIEYADNGTGGPLKKGNGLRNAENRIHSVKGTIIFEPTERNGFKAKIKV